MEVYQDFQVGCAMRIGDSAVRYGAIVAIASSHIDAPTPNRIFHFSLFTSYFPGCFDILMV